MPFSSSSNVPNRIFVDASHTFKSGLNTGVQRVVRNACTLAGDSTECQSVNTVVLASGHFSLADLRAETEARRSLHEIRRDVLAHMPETYKSISRCICKLLPFPTLRRWLLPEAGHHGMFKIPLKAYEKWLSRRDARKTVQPGAGDLLILPDAYWARSEIWPAVKEAKSRGAKVAVLLYDLIPLTHPQFVPEQAVEPFREYLQSVAEHADMTVAISDTVRRQVEELFGQPDYATNCQHFSSFELGAEFQLAQGSVRDHIRAVFTEEAVNAPHLMVATFDPRKNHHYALDAFEKVWEKHPSRKLCFIGRVGWLCSDVIERIQNHPRLGKQLFALHDVSDAELNYCYQRARSVLFPSIVEGFGLPIVEALWHGKHVFASGTEIHREVGRNECSYCDLSSSGSLADQILEWELQQSEVSPVRDSAYEPVSWAQSIASLTSQCCELLREQEPVSFVESRAA